VTLRSRIAWTAGVATAAVAIVISVVAILTTRHELRVQLDHELVSDANRAATRAAISPTQARPFALPFLPPSSATFDRRQSQSRMFESSGHVDFEGQYPAITLDASDRAVARGTLSSHLRDATGKGVDYRVATVHVKGTKRAVQVARPTSDIEDTVSRLTLILALCGLGGALIALILGWFVARSAVKPVSSLAEVATHVADTEDLTVEVPERGGRELEGLAASFNRMLRTLEAARAQQRQLVADASHELRTPLTSLRTNLEVLASGATLSEVDRADLLSDVGAQIEELSELVTDLLELARDEIDHREGYIDLRLDHVVEAALDRARRRAVRVDIEADLEPVLVHGDPELLERAVLNIVDNAIKWSPPDGRVTVQLAGGALVISDQGPGIATEDRDHVFERFWRAPIARSQRGSGLGLAIVAQVVASHDGTATVDTAPGGGARIIVRLPVIAIDEPAVLASH
jgi:two-component system sensor histidine kinase MprB